MTTDFGFLTRSIFTHGCGAFGALGQGNDLHDTPVFKRLNLSGASDFIVEAKQVSAGWGHSAAVTESGNLAIFGRPYDDSTIMTLNRIKTFSPHIARYYGNSTKRQNAFFEVNVTESILLVRMFLL
jgi:alpha-tubulin suppressor-like RCC1 family protein